MSTWHKNKEMRKILSLSENVLGSHATYRKANMKTCRNARCQMIRAIAQLYKTCYFEWRKNHILFSSLRPNGLRLFKVC